MAVVNLQNAEYLEKAPVYWEPKSREANLAALVAYNLGDGHIENNKNRFITSFVAQDARDVSDICAALESVFKRKWKVEKSSTLPGTTQNHRVRINHASTSAEMLQLGCVSGKKVEQAFSVPKWVLEGDKEVKRAFISALWGAEGTTPAPRKNRNRAPTPPKLQMHKKVGVDGFAFFNGLREILLDFNVNSKVVRTDSVTGHMYTLHINTEKANLIRFFEEVGCLFAHKKKLQMWLWAAYLRAYSYSAVNKSVSSRKKGYVARMRCSKTFPLFYGWIAERWDESRNVLKVFVVSCKESGHDEVWNMHVDSHDRSYLIQSGINNFNSWESPTGKVYQPFQRMTHVISNIDDDGKCNLHLGLDFNRFPMSGVLIVKFLDSEGEECLQVIDEILLPNATIQKYADLLTDKFKGRSLTIYPDASGNQQHTSAGGNTNHSVLRGVGYKLIMPRKNPAVSDRVNIVNSAFLSATGKKKLFIHPRCKELITSLESLGFDDNGNVAKNGPQAKYTHLPDALGYAIMNLMPIVNRKIGNGVAKMKGVY